MSALQPFPQLNSSLKGKVAIVTGAGALKGKIGNGRATAFLLADAGCSVVCVDLKIELAQETADLISNSATSGFAIPFAGDVTSPSACESAVDLAVKTYGRLDILVNNVGILGPPGDATAVDVGAFVRGLEVNVCSMVWMSKYAIPAMIKNEGQCAGSIINMGSVAGLKGGTPSLLYPTSKGAVINMTRAMAAHHGHQRVRVNCLCPGKWNCAKLPSSPDLC